MPATPEKAKTASPKPTSPTSKPGSKVASPKSPRSPSGGPTTSGAAVFEALAPLEAAEFQDDEGVDVDFLSSTASISSSILDYRQINGRTYHSKRDNVEYWGANDAQANETMDIVGHLFTMVQDDKLHLAPITKNIKKALDIGCGTGIWTMDFADEFPDTEVIGTDISPIQPSWVAPNLKFVIEDCTQPWTFAPESFDYVHSRYLIGSFDTWNDFFAEAYRVLKPGGWCESFETDGCWLTDDDTHGPATKQWGNFFIEGSKKLGKGRAATVVPDGSQEKGMAAAGFTDIQIRWFKCPVGGWPKDPRLKHMGQLAHAAVDNDIEGFILYMATVLGWKHEEVQVYMANLRREMKSGKHHTYTRIKVVWARKPE